MSSFINKVYIPSEIMTKSSTSISHTAPNRIYTSQFLTDILSLSADEIKQLIGNDNFRLLHADLKEFYDVNKHSEENQLNHFFEEFLQKRNIRCIHDTCTYGDKIFTDLFSNLKPDMSWNTTNDTRLNEFCSCPFYYKSIIELKKNTLKNKDFDQLSSYLTSILRYSPGRTFIIGCITNFQETNLIKVSYDEEKNEIKSMIQAMVTTLTGLEILTLYLGLSDRVLGYNERFVQFIFKKKMKFLNYLGRGSSSFVFFCEYQQETLTNMVVKISRKNAVKEKYIIDKMNQIKPHDVDLIQCVDMNLDEVYLDYLIAFNLRGNKLEGSFVQHFINNSILLVNTWNQINLCHRTGFIHSDIRIGNLIVCNGNVYVIDYSSAIPVNILNHYQGCLSTASNNILKILDVNNSMSRANEKIQLYYADDGMSYLKMILLLKDFFQKYSLLIKQAIADDMTCHILSTYEYAMDVLHEKNIVKTIRYLEKHRETLSMNDLNLIMIHTLENENQIDYDINKHLDKLSLS